MTQSSHQDLVLARLGIERYRLRSRERADAMPAREPSNVQDSPPRTRPQTASTSSQPPSAAPAGLAELRAALTDAVPSEPSEATVGARPDTPVSQPEAERLSTPPTEAVDLLCLVNTAVFIVLPATQAPDTHRLLEDLMLAVAGGERFASLNFRWPDPALGDTADPQSVQRAWQAFYTRRASKAAHRLAVDMPVLRSLLGESDVLWLPPLDTVVGSADGKRALWMQLRERVQSANP